MTKYKNELLGFSKIEIKKEWDNCWERISKLNPIQDSEELAELNEKFDRCVEAFYATDCGDYWEVRSARCVNGKVKHYKVEKSF